MKTPYKNLIILSLIGLTLFFYFVGQNERHKRFELRDQVNILKKENTSLKAALNDRDDIITSSYNGLK